MRSFSLTPFLALASLSGISVLGATIPSRATGDVLFNGSFVIDNYRLYPENLDYDSEHGLLYLGSNFNATVMVYDPHTVTWEILTFDGITDTAPFHASGIDFDLKSHSIYISANSGTPFESSGFNLTGPNYIFRYDTRTKQIVYKADLGDFLAQVTATSGASANGIQDMAEDSDGNSYVPVSFGWKAIAKITPDGTVTPWYIAADSGTPNPYYPSMYNGLIYHPSGKLVVTDGQNGSFVTFDTASPSGTPRNVITTGFPSDYTAISCDGALNPARFPNRDVILCSEDTLGANGAITVFTSTDNWVTAKYVGRVDNDDPRANGSIPSATVQIDNSIYISPFFASDGPLPDTAGNRSSFPFIDISSRIDALLIPEGIQICGN